VVGNQKQAEVAQDTYRCARRHRGAWSLDSKWLAYSKVLPNQLSAIHLYSLADGKSTQVTDGMSDADYPVFDKDGKYLYFTASTNSGESLGLDIHATARTANSSIYVAVLDRTIAFAPRRGRRGRGEKPPKPPNRWHRRTARSEVNRRRRPAEAGAGVKIDLDGIDQRAPSVPCLRGATRASGGEGGTCSHSRRSSPERPPGGGRAGDPPLRPECRAM
jgi:tricorn protease